MGAHRLRGPFEAALAGVTAPVAAPPPTGSRMHGHRVRPDLPYRDDAGLFALQSPAGWYVAGPRPAPGLSADPPPVRDDAVVLADGTPARLLEAALRSPVIGP